MPTRTGAIPLVVKSYEGRPVKIEGNALFPGSNGGTDRYAQASILDLYDPDRARHFKHDGKEVSREEALNFLDELSKKFAANTAKAWRSWPKAARRRRARGCKKSSRRNFRNRSGSPTTRLIPAFINARRRRRSASRCKPVFNFDKAKVILSLDCDFLGGEDDAHNHIRKFAAGRKAGEGMSRLYAVESLFTLTGANADHRLRVAASLIGKLRQRFRRRTISGGSSSGGKSFDVMHSGFPNAPKIWLPIVAKMLGRGRSAPAD